MPPLVAAGATATELMVAPTLIAAAWNMPGTPERWKQLAPENAAVLVEFRGEDETVPIKPEHKMTLDQVRKEVEPQGFSFKESLEFLPWQHVIIFEKPEKPTKADDKKAGATPGTDAKQKE